MTSEDDYFIAWNQHGSFSFDGERELDEKDCPAVIRHVILFNRVNTTIAFVATEDVNVAILKDYCWHGAALLVQFCNAFPPVQVDWVSFAALKHAIDGTTTDCVHIVTLVGQCVRVAALKQWTLLLRRLINRVVHEDLSANICERWVQATCDQYAAVIETNCHGITL